ncbi:MAG: hypothetical protein WAO78_02375 [Roseovarius sp.]
MEDAGGAKFLTLSGCPAPGTRAAIWAIPDGFLNPDARFADLMAHLFAAPEAP